MGLARNTLRRVAGSTPVSRWLFWWRLGRRTGPIPRTALWESALVDLLRYGWRSRRPLPVARRPFLVVLRNGTRFEVRAGTDDPLSVLPGREEAPERAILDPLRAGGRVLVDAGADIGFHSSQAAGLGSAFALAVEADPQSAAQCRRNLEQNGLEGTWRLETAVVGERAVETAEEAGGSIEVPRTTLDRLTVDLPEIDVLKIDLGGRELSALRGAAETLARTRRVVCRCDRDKHEIVVHLTGSGFCVRSLASTTWVVGDRG